MKQIICIECPKGCRLQVDEQNDYTVTGNMCKRGLVYGRSESINPQRMISSTVKIAGSIYSRLPVVTTNPVSKSLVFDIMKALDDILVTAPIKCGDIIATNICDSGSNIVASRNM